MKYATIIAASAAMMATAFVAPDPAFARIKGENRPGEMCTGPADMDPDTDYRYGRCDIVCRGKDIKKVDDIWDCTGTFNRVSVEIDLGEDDDGSDGTKEIVIPVQAINDLVALRTARLSAKPRGGVPTSPVNVSKVKAAHYEQ